MPGHGSRIAAALGTVLPAPLLVLLSLLTVMWLWPDLPYPQQDSEWALALNQAVADRLAFGRDVIYPLGPWGNVYAGQYHPATDAMTMAGGALLALALSAGLLALVRGSRRWLLLLAPLLVATVGERDPVFLFTPLLLVAVAARSKFAPPGRLGSVALVLLAVACGMLVLVKGTFATQSVPMVGLAVLALLLGRRVRLAALVAGSYAAAVAGLWLCAGQRLPDLSAYGATMLAVVNGYSEGLALDGPASDIVAYLAAAAALLWLVWRSRAQGGLAGTAVLGLGLLLTLFLAFKSGFVRHDEHALIAAGTLAMAPLALAGTLRPRALIAGLLATLAALTFISQHHPGYEWPSWERGRQRLVLAAVGAWDRTTQPGRLPRLFGAYMANARTAMPLPRLDGPSDIYSSGQMALLANGLQWSPRPALQGVTVLGDVLARADLAHLQGADGRPPVQNVFFRVENQDNRLRSLDDGLSWPALLGSFHVEGYDRALDTAILRRLPGVPPPAPGPVLLNGSYRLGEEVPLPPLPGGLAWAALDIRPTLAGRLAAFLFRPPLLTVTIRYANGQTEHFRLVSALARLGFLLSPRVLNTEDMLSLLLPERRAPGVRPVSLAVTGESGTRWLWEPRFTLRLQAMDIPVQEQVRAMLAPAPLLPAPAPPSDAGLAEACTVELVDGHSPPDKPIPVGGTVEVSGWAVVSAARGEAPDRVVIRLTDTAGHAWETVADLRPRIDVAGFFVNPALSAAGFDARFDASALRGDYKVTILAQRGGSSWRCRTALDVVAARSGRGPPE